MNPDVVLKFMDTAEKAGVVEQNMDERDDLRRKVAELGHKIEALKIVLACRGKEIARLRAIIKQ